MIKELVIQSLPQSTGFEIALLEDRRLMEFYIDDSKKDFSVGDVYIGRVKKLLPGLNAAFVDVGDDKDSFLHYHDLGPQIKSSLSFFSQIAKGAKLNPNLSDFKVQPDIFKTGTITDVLEQNMKLPVQIAKESISSKGLRLSSQLSISGRYLILIPFSSKISISKKIIAKKERMRLKDIVRGLMPDKNFGTIIRTNAKDVDFDTLKADFELAFSVWKKIVESASAGKTKLHSEANRTNSILRDVVNSTFQRVVVDDESRYKEIQSFLNTNGMNQNILKLIEPPGSKSLFEHLELDKQKKASLSKIVNIGGGAYLIIESTEAMHVIDVNSGSKRARVNTQENNVLSTNMLAANEVARQLRLRDLGGIIIIDFIDMPSAANRKALFDYMSQIMNSDRAKHTILPLTRFGLMQITRQRSYSEKKSIDNLESCPLCFGSGEVNKDYSITADMKTLLLNHIEASTGKQLVIEVHPMVKTYFESGWPSQRWKWSRKYGKKIKLQANDAVPLNHFHTM